MYGCTAVYRLCSLSRTTSVAVVAPSLARPGTSGSWRNRLIRTGLQRQLATPRRRDVSLLLMYFYSSRAPSPLYPPQLSAPLGPSTQRPARRLRLTGRKRQEVLFRRADDHERRRHAFFVASFVAGRPTSHWKCYLSGCSCLAYFNFFLKYIGRELHQISRTEMLLLSISILMYSAR